MSFNPWDHLHETLHQERQLSGYRRLCTALGAPMFQFGFFLWGIWMIFVWIAAHDRSHPAIVAVVAIAALLCLLLALFGLKRGMLGTLLLRHGTFAEGLIVSRRRTPIFVSGPRATSGSRRSQQYLWKTTVQFERPGQGEPIRFNTLAVAEYGPGPAEESNVGKTLVMYNPSTPARAMMLSDIPLDNQFQSFERLTPSAPPAKILIWPAVIVVGHVWALIWFLTVQ